MMSDRKRRERLAEMAVGVLFFIGLLGLGYVTVLLSHRDLLGRQTHIRSNFDSVGGLRKGDRILVRGMEAGKVSKLRFHEGRVQVMLLFDEKPTIHEDYRLRIRQSTVLGGRFVELDEGTLEAPIVPLGTVLEGSPAFDLVADVEDLIGGMGDAIVWIRDALREGGLIENLSQAGSDVSKLMQDIREGEGTLGLLIRDPQLYNRTVTAMDNLALFAEDIQQATGTIPRLFHDPSLYESAERLFTQLEGFSANLDHLGTNLDTFAGRLDRLGSQISEGTGTISRLINDPSLYEDVQATAANLRTISEDLAEGRGTMGKILKDEGELYASLQSALKNLEDVSVSLKEGQGTMGKLLTDDELYNDIQGLVAELRAVVEDFREQTPVTTFSGVVLGAF
jgi:phospholipid/cholesterol/gamma-HCH transport system substrate-binding protein